MKDIREIYSRLKDKNWEQLIDKYEKRQDKNILLNEKMIQKYLKSLKWNISFLDENMSALEQFNFLLLMVLNSQDKDIIKRFLKVLYLNDYNNKAELLCMMQLADKLFSEDVNAHEFLYSMNGLTTFENLLVHKNNEIGISTSDAFINIKKANDVLKQPEIDKEKRRGYCHDMTTQMILENPKLYGLYYYIPEIFKGTIDHSIVLDTETNLIYDMANNVTIPYIIFKSVYGLPSFRISGQDMQKLQKALGTNINMCLIAEALMEDKKTYSRSRK